jgi:Right handed beta helix region
MARSHKHRVRGCRARHHSRRHRHVAPRRPAPPIPVPPVPSGTPTPPPVHCDLFASPTGSDSAGDGSIGKPLASVQQLDRVLAPGQTGCLRSGSYGSLTTWHQIYTNGAPSAQITITSYPGELATVTGYLDIEASYTTFTHLRIDGSNTLYKSHPSGVNCPNNVSQSLVIAGHDDILDHIDYFQSVAALRGNAIGIGFWGDADNTIIRYSKIHDVGQCFAYDHLIYLAHGNNVQIYDNWLYDDPHGRGVQLYPGPTNARIYNNVIDSAGEGFVIGNLQGETVSGNQIFHNVVTNCVGLPWQGIPGQAIHDLYLGAPGTGNSFHDNLLFGDPGGVGRVTAVQLWNNVTADPLFVSASAHDYALLAGSPASGWGLWSGQ